MLVVVAVAPFRSSGFIVDGTNPQDVLYMGVRINHRTWGLCHLL